MICPRCEGQKYDVGSCSLCNNSGVLLDEGVLPLEFIEDDLDRRSGTARIFDAQNRGVYDGDPELARVIVSAVNRLCDPEAAPIEGEEEA